ncbi:hypothetical protein CBER1_11784 [Cercospora berteroae]|uniref:BTB domain-containing protein n=1 Tax=Cercospora berteroae TaxID=357750 RepID=A0A2S6BWS5_9PEZI|nr:hypothetical protein CBER1_11784 [Cercospora berteroae]
MSDEIRVAKRRRITSDLVEITVGEDKGGPFKIQRFLLEENSEFFKAALRDEWTEGQEKKVHLADDDCETFAVFEEWLYSGKIGSKEGCDTKKLTAPQIYREQQLIAKLYVLAEKLIADRLGNCVLRAMAELCTTTGYHITSTAMGTIYRGTTETSLMRKFLVDSFYKHVDPEFLTEANAWAAWAHPYQFWCDLTRKCLAFHDRSKVTAPEDNIEIYLKNE